MSSPLVTVVIPTRDRPHLVDRAIDSVLSQTIDDFEILVVDDGSTEAYRPSSNDPRITLLRHERSRGPSAARNTAPGPGHAAAASVSIASRRLRGMDCSRVERMVREDSLLGRRRRIIIPQRP